MSSASEKYLHPLSKVYINYWFFGFYFTFISIVHLYHVCLVEPTFSFSRYFFLAYALAQCAIETMLLMLFANGIRFFFRSTGMMIYSFAVFFLLLSHLIDFPLVRFMDMSFWYALNFITQESSRNFLELLYASNVSLIIWFLSGLLGLTVLLSGTLLYKSTERWSDKRPMIVPYPLLAIILCALCLFTITWDYSTQKFVQCNYFDLYQKTLPWKSTAFHQRQEYVPLAHSLQPPKLQQDLIETPVLEKKPDIFLFIVESLREDFITAENAPHLNAFKRENVSFDLALANANATQLSWFSLFYSQFPFHFGNTHPKEQKGGSTALQLLKKMGYSIHVYSSARLGYYQMDEVVFGQHAHLADALCTFEDVDMPPWERDQQAIDKMIEEMKQGAGGRLFIVFLDATHLDYSWPTEECSLFEPYEEKINYLMAAFSNAGLEKIKNRYRNALFFVDTQFGKFLKTLAECKGGDDALVIFTGDHGEEFYEQGHLFHASGLSHPQIHVPLYYKFGQLDLASAAREEALSSHMDIFPSIFHYLIGENAMAHLFQGQSIFSTERWPYVVSARFNASRSPCEFCIHNGTYKLTATFSDERSIFNSKGLRIISMKDLEDHGIYSDGHSLKTQFNGALDHIFAPQ